MKTFHIPAHAGSDRNQEARAEAGPGDHCGGGGYDARHACEEASERAVELMNEERRRADGGPYDEVLL